MIPYFGKLPQYAPYYFESVRQAHLIDVLLFTDAHVTFPLPSNVKVYPFALADFNDLASRALGLAIEVRDAYKLCDFKPAYGTIFKDYLRGYRHWGAGDIDLIYGNLAVFLEPMLSEEYDIISCRRGWISGSLFVCKDYSHCRFDVRPKFRLAVRVQGPHCLCFDEMGGHFFTAVESGADLLSLKGCVESFTHTVLKLSKSGVLRCKFENLACEGLDSGRNPPLRKRNTYKEQRRLPGDVPPLGIDETKVFSRARDRDRSAEVLHTKDRHLYRTGTLTHAAPKGGNACGSGRHRGARTVVRAMRSKNKPSSDR